MKHLNRCKTCTGWIFLLLNVVGVIQGDHPCSVSDGPTKRHSTCGYHGWSPWRTCYVFADAARGQAKNPKVKFCKVYVLVFMDCATQDCGSTSLAVAMVAPTTYLAFIWNVKGKGQLPISIFLPLWSGFIGLFLHAQCIPHHNSIRQLWANVWVMSDSTGWHEPFGGYLCR